MPWAFPAAGADEGNDGDSKRPSKRSDGDRTLFGAGGGAASIAYSCLCEAANNDTPSRNKKQECRRIQIERGLELAHRQPYDQG